MNFPILTSNCLWGIFLTLSAPLDGKRYISNLREFSQTISQNPWISRFHGGWRMNCCICQVSLDVIMQSHLVHCGNSTAALARTFVCWLGGLWFLIEEGLKNLPMLPGRCSLNWVPGKCSGNAKAADLVLITRIGLPSDDWLKTGCNINCPIREVFNNIILIKFP